MQFIDLLKCINKEYDYCKKVMNKYFNKNLKGFNHVISVGYVKNYLWGIIK